MKISLIEFLYSIAYLGPKLFRLLRNLPFQLILCLFFGFLFGKSIPVFYANILYTASCLVQDLLMLVIPLVCFSYIWAAINAFGNRGFIMIITICALVVLANMTAIFAAYGASSIFLPYVIDAGNPIKLSQDIDSLNALWSLSRHLNLQLIQPKHGMIGGFSMGILTILLNRTQSQSVPPNIERFLAYLGKSFVEFSDVLRNYVTIILKTYFIPLLPFYVLGFVVKLAYDGDLSTILQGYAHTFIFLYIVVSIYLLFWYFVGCKFNIRATLNSLKNMVSAGLTGFTTMSSTATMPLTLEAIQENTNDQNFANFFTPATVNCHLAGDGLSITVTAIALLLMAGHPFPSSTNFFLFAFYYALAKFSAAGIPGGGVIVILPVARDYLGIDESLMPLLQTLYILQDPFLTSSNVLGNGAFALIAKKIMQPLMNKKDLTCN